jgi:hypothetical protein
MDRAEDDADPVVSGGCDGFLPTPRDKNLVQDLYDTVAPTGVNIGSTTGPDATFQFTDTNPAEAQYGVFVQRWMGGDWIDAAQFFVENGVAPCDAVPCNNNLTVIYRKPGALPDGSYRLCAFAYNAAFLNSEATCSLSRQLRSNLAFDSDGDGFSDRSEAGTPFCEDNSNADHPPDNNPQLNDHPNDGCPARGGLRELEGPNVTMQRMTTAVTIRS